MMGVSVQTIRYYCKIGLIRPAYTNGETGYRYFAPEQLHYIDRIRYLTKCGLSLKDIQQIIAGNDIDLLTRRLAEEKDRQLQRIREAANLVATIDWYRDYFPGGEAAPGRNHHIPGAPLSGPQYRDGAVGAGTVL